MTDTASPAIITKIKFENFKSFEGKFELKLNKSVNIFVGDNEAGKSTILEAIHLALTGVFQGRYIRNDLSQYLFNINVVEAYIKSIKDGTPVAPPHLLIEVFMEGEGITELEGNGNRDKEDSAGIWVKIAFDEKYKSEYEDLIQRDEVTTLPIEYYELTSESFARKPITSRSIPIKSALIDSSGSKAVNGSDMYVSRIVKDSLETKEIVDIAQAHRKMRETFMVDDSIVNINKKIEESTKIRGKNIKLAVDLSVKNSWESTLITYVNDIPFHFAGKGEQSVIKTKLALGNKKSLEASLLLLEEPENHLSHATLSELLVDIEEEHKSKQIMVSTHSSFVANKLGLDNLILLNDNKTTTLSALDDSTRDFFLKISGYDTLRLVLCKKAILVEGDSDELVVQKAYMIAHGGHLPIQDGIDVISVGTAFLRFLDVADRLGKPVVVVTDNDGDPAVLKSKYAAYYDAEGNPIKNVDICFDETVDTGSLKIGTKDYNYNTLEPKIIKANSLKKINTILGTSYTDTDDLRKHMKAYKTDSALKIFNTKEEIVFPQYIVDAVK